MPQIEIDDEVFTAIQAAAEPLVDDANSVLRRLFGLDRDGDGPSRALSNGNRAPLGSQLSEEAFRDAILLELLAGEGKGTAKLVTDKVGERLGDQLGDWDLRQLNSGDPRWRTRVQFTRMHMKEGGLLEAGSPRGHWILTDAGRQLAESLQNG